MSAEIVTGRDPATGRPIAVTVQDGVVVEVAPGPEAADGWLSAGLVDLQVNGYAGHDLNSGALTPETVIALAAALRKTGVTTFLPTLITASRENLVAALRTIAEARASDALTAHMTPRLHIEGPQRLARGRAARRSSARARPRARPGRIRRMAGRVRRADRARHALAALA